MNAIQLEPINGYITLKISLPRLYQNSQKKANVIYRSTEAHERLLDEICGERSELLAVRFAVC